MRSYYCWWCRDVDCERCYGNDLTGNKGNHMSYKYRQNDMSIAGVLFFVILAIAFFAGWVMNILNCAAPLVSQGWL